MTIKKLLPVLLLVLMAALTLFLKRSHQTPATIGRQVEQHPSGNITANTSNSGELNRNTSDLFYTKHAKCRMLCRHITQQEVKDILLNGTINYNKSNLNDPRGATYALEGMTNDRQHVRIIFAPKQQHLTVVTVIDLEKEFTCNCS